MPYEQAMTVPEREAFLEDVHVAVLTVDEPGRGPFAAPIWYRYLDGMVELAMDNRSKKAQLLRAAGRATLLVQDEVPPYKYVCVEGPVEFSDRERDVTAVARRYLGDEIGDWYAKRNPATHNTVVVLLRPDHWRTQDFSGAGSGG